MKIFECKCGSKDIFIKDSGNNKGLYCADCGKWMQWLGKDDLRLTERQIEQSIVNPVPRNLDELKEHDKHIIAEAKEKAINEYNSKIKEVCKIVGSCDFEDLDRIAKQLKEQK